MSHGHIDIGTVRRGTEMAEFRFDHDLPIMTAEQAIYRADQFLAKFSYLARRPLSAYQEGDHWNVAVDVALFGAQIVRLVVNSDSGAITGFSDEGLS